MSRVFVAIDLPEQAKNLLVQWKRELVTARWVPPDQLHLTLRFIGEVGPETFAAIKLALTRISYPRFPLVLRGVGHFPPGKKPPRVLWVGLDPSPELARLQQDVELALIDAGIAPDERRFSAHVTLARLKEETSPASVAAFEERHRDLLLDPFEVSEVILYSSVLTPKGAIHSKEAVLPCQASPRSL